MYIKGKEKFGFGMAALGQGAVYAMMSSWLVRFYTDVMVLPALFITVLMWAARIWDAVNDPLMGFIVDRTNTRFGKMRVYLLITTLPIALFTVLLFTAPNWSTPWKMVYAAVTYVLWGMIYTLSDVPFWGLPSAMTPDNAERASFLGFARTFNSVGAALPLVLVAVISKDSLLGQRKGYFVAALIFAVFGIALFALGFFVTKERIPPQTEKLSFKNTFGLIKQNKPLMLGCLLGMLNFGRYMVQGAASYAADYVYTSSNAFLNGNKVLIVSVLVGVGMFPAMLLMPLLFKKFNHKQIAVGAGAFSFISGIALYFVSVWTNYELIYAMPLLFLCGMPLGIFNVLTFAVISDSIDYLEWKTGKRAEGICSSCQTFVNKFGAAVSAGLIPMFLSLIKYVAPVDNVMQAQSAGTVKGILALISIVPAVSMAVSVLPMLGYDFVGKKKQEILNELNARRALI